MNREWITGRNPVYEVLRAGRRRVFRLHLTEGAQEKGRLLEVLQQCAARKLPVERVGRSQLEARFPGNQGMALEVSEYPYSDLTDILELASDRSEPGTSGIKR